MKTPNIQTFSKIFKQKIFLKFRDIRCLAVLHHHRSGPNLGSLGARLSPDSCSGSKTGDTRNKSSNGLARNSVKEHDAVIEKVPGSTRFSHATASHTVKTRSFLQGLRNARFSEALRLGWVQGLVKGVLSSGEASIFFYVFETIWPVVQNVGTDTPDFFSGQ